MKKVRPVITFLIFLIFLGGDEWIMAGGGTIKNFDVLGGGGVIVNDSIVFRNMAEYFKSDIFENNDGRCSSRRRRRRDTKDSNQGTGGNETGPVTDCSFEQQVVRSQYWPEGVYVIPVVFHIIYKPNGVGNIPDSRVIDQVAVLNEDFRALAGSMGEAGFDARIQFKLAGITRTANNKWFRDRGQEFDYKSALAWDVNRYMNVYVNTASGSLGYSYFPQDSAGQWMDGITIMYSTIGGRGQGEPPYDQGRTLVHEAGHYLGLEHTFYGECCNGYDCGDLISDTPGEKRAHYGCTPSDECHESAPIHNYMNYTDDSCMREFTPEQANRMVCVLLNYRIHLY